MQYSLPSLQCFPWLSRNESRALRDILSYKGDHRRNCKETKSSRMSCLLVNGRSLTHTLSVFAVFSSPKILLSDTVTELFSYSDCPVAQCKDRVFYVQHAELSIFTLSHSKCSTRETKKFQSISCYDNFYGNCDVTS